MGGVSIIVGEFGVGGLVCVRGVLSVWILHRGVLMEWYNARARYDARETCIMHVNEC